MKYFNYTGLLCGNGILRVGILRLKLQSETIGLHVSYECSAMPQRLITQFGVRDHEEVKS